MTTYSWEMHDKLINTCNTLARTLIATIDKARDRITLKDKADKTGEHHKDIVKKWEMLQTWRHRAQRAMNLCDWERLGRTGDRTHSPYDTEPAIRSRYAWALGIRGQTPVSPMRVLWQLERRLNEAVGDVVRI
jgi:hypothetical protein